MDKIPFRRTFFFRTRKSQANIKLRDRCLCTSTEKEPHTVADQVELTSVTKRFNDVVAVDSISLVVKPGEFLSILGPSECGRTTLRMVILGS
jgi:ABC-type glutathione transport system ATPase component